MVYGVWFMVYGVWCTLCTAPSSTPTRGSSWSPIWARTECMTLTPSFTSTSCNALPASHSATFGRCSTLGGGREVVGGVGVWLVGGMGVGMGCLPGCGSRCRSGWRSEFVAHLALGSKEVKGGSGIMTSFCHSALLPFCHSVSFASLPSCFRTCVSKCAL